VIDGQPARLVIGDQIPFATSTQTSSNTGGTTITRNVQILDTGVVLQITPRIHANNSVDLNIVQSVSTPKGDNGADMTPTVSTRDISSQILGQSGRTILLGGMIQDRMSANRTGIPGMGDLPVIGNLFSQQDHGGERTELLVLITPRVVRNSSEIENITRQLQDAVAHRY
jgi:general secretion pathway protein D